MNKYILTLTVLTILSTACLWASDSPKEIPLWQSGAPGSESRMNVKEKARIFDQTGDHVVSNIHNPSITPYLPAKEISTGAAVIICPGGGHRELWIDHEGYTPARWLSERGIAAIILKYRLARDSNSTYSIDRDEVADIQRAIRVVKSHAHEWNIDTSKVGVMGFSAGGELAGLSAMRFDYGNVNAPDPIGKESSRPAFQALIYPGGFANQEPAQNAPPLFLAGGYNDRPDISEGIAQIYLKYKKAGIPAELHIYANAGHGFGMRESNHTASAGWPSRFVEWLKDMGFVK